MRKVWKRFQTTKIWGGLVALIYQLLPQTRSKLDSVVRNILEEAEEVPREKTFVMMVGYSLSGKTWFVRNHPRVSCFFQVSSRRIHDLLNESFPLLQDDKTVSGPGYWPRQALTWALRRRVIEEACRRGLALVSDSGNQTRRDRKGRLSIPEKFGYKTIIVWVMCEEKLLMGRLQKADQERLSRGEEPTWVRLYQDVQRGRFEAPWEHEADEFIIFQSVLKDLETIKI